MQIRPGGIASYCAQYFAALWLLHPALGRASEASAAPVVHPERWPRLKPALARDSIAPDDLAHYPLGSVLNGGNSSPHGDKLAPPGEWLAMAGRFYDAALGAAGSAAPRSGSPVSIGRFPPARRWPATPAGAAPARTTASCRRFPRAGPASPLRSQSAAPAPTATQARSEFDTEPMLKPRAAAAMRVRACPSGIGGFRSPFFAL
jgi:hypothetical protein